MPTALIEKVTDMQSYLYIGGNQDSLNAPTPDGADSVQVPLDVTDKETYNRLTLSLGDASTVVYVHESLTPAQALNELILSHKSWCKNRPGSRL